EKAWAIVMPVSKKIASLEDRENNPLAIFRTEKEARNEAVQPEEKIVKVEIKIIKQ
ncbi:unnamed protein product, partial [marine sediment metagenome]